MYIRATPTEPAHLKWKDFDIPIPKRWGPALLVVSVVMVFFAAAGVYLYIKLDDHNKASAAGEQRIAADDLETMNETQRHFGEVPERALPLRGEDDPRGPLIVSMFHSGCVSYSGRDPVKDQRVLKFYAVDAHKVAVKVVAEQVLPAVRGLESAAWASEPPVIPRGCIEPWTAHPGKFLWKYGERYDTCRVQVTRWWLDGPNGAPGCEMTETYDGCQGVWSGARWVKCVHANGGG